MLSKYKNYPNIGMISGTNYLQGNNGNSQLFFFSKYFAIWGWATWREKWCLYQNDLPDWPLQKKNKWLASIFQNKNIVKYYTFVFDKMIDGYFDTWDVNWTYYLLKYNQLTITPIENLISNIGVTGTHMEGANPNFFNMPKGKFDKQNTNTPREVAQDKILDDIQFNNTGISQYSWKITFRLFLSQLHLLSIVLRFKKALKL
ncbi:MAG TPA: hypothetical protein PK720_04155 [bacterium]|nr:hypothetical protein [bacterium]